MSCRVAGKFVESALFSHLLQAEGCELGRFEVVKTQKNILLRNTLEQIGFKTDFNTENKLVYSFDMHLINNTIIRIREDKSK